MSQVLLLPEPFLPVAPERAHAIAGTAPWFAAGARARSAAARGASPFTIAPPPLSARAVALAVAVPLSVALLGAVVALFEAAPFV